MILNETYLGFTGSEAKAVKGKRIDDDYAVIVENIEGKRRYQIIHIKSGLSISRNPYNTIKDALNGFNADLLAAHSLADFDEIIAVGISRLEELKRNEIII